MLPVRCHVHRGCALAGQPFELKRRCGQYGTPKPIPAMSILALPLP